MTTYLLDALENYDPATAAAIDDNSIQPAYITTTSTYIGMAYDRVNRRLVYTCTKAPGADPTAATNTTGHTLWDGVTSVANGSPLDLTENFNVTLALKSIDTLAVTFHDIWNSANLVPASAAGDGTWRRYVSDTNLEENANAITDPRTGNVWWRPVGGGLHQFQASDSFTQTISPLRSPGVSSEHIGAVAMNNDWVIAAATNVSGDNHYHFYFTPRVRTSDETTADVLSSYANYVAPFNSNVYLYRTCVDEAGVVWIPTMLWTSSAEIKFHLYKLDQPTSAPFGGPVVGGGFTDMTPWTSTTGPNASAVGTAYVGSAQGSLNCLPLYRLPSNKLALVTQMTADLFGVGHPEKYSLNCTYYDIAGASFEQHDGFVTGYMNSDWTPAGNSVPTAGYEVRFMREVDQDVQAHDFVFSDFNYSTRWFEFDVLLIEGGVVQTGFSPCGVMAKYSFVPGQAPALVSFIDFQPWDSAYPDYFDAIPGGGVIGASLSVPGSSWVNTYWGTLNDGGIRDDTNNAFWFSGYNGNFWDLDAAFTPRESVTGPDGSTPAYTTPFMRMSMSSATFRTQGYIF